MKKIREFIVNHSLLIVIVTLIGMVPMLIGYMNTRINYDILVYLPKDIDTMKGQDILSEDFGLGGYAFVMVDNMSNYDTLELEKKYRNIDGVNKVFADSCLFCSESCAVCFEDASFVTEVSDASGFGSSCCGCAICSV